jgi:glycine/D-amino acid oxidase-like deaminating enzyme/nitrite reductase/ring-hydroxylating ferredoxin subunit
MIPRDGNCKSLWQATGDEYQPKNKPLSDHYDVIIAGGGITGVSTALLLQESGKKCLLLEANNLCFGTTGGTTAHLNTLLDTTYDSISSNFGKQTAKLVAQSVKDAIELIKHNIRQYQIDCGFEETDGFLFAQTREQEKELEIIKNSTIEAGVPAAYTNTIPVAIAFSKAIQIKGQAKFVPTQYVFGLAAAFENAGGIILQKCRVTGAEEKEVVTVETNIGVFNANALIYATHIPPAVNLLHLRCVPYRSYAMAITLSDEKYPEGLIYNMYDPYNYYRSQVINGRSYLIGGGYDHKTAHEENTEKCFLQLEAHLRGNFKVKDIVYKWSSQFFEPADGLPYIGKLPGHKGNIYTATGYGGNGMIYSSVAAILLRDMVTGKPNPYQDIFNPGRIKPVAGFVNFIRHNADVAKLFAGKWFPHEDLESLTGLSKGEGKVVNYKDEKMAVYKDPEGKLHAVSPICTHLKCEVKWNVAERSWDCPCHGARYSYDGKVITGPADRDLETIVIKSLVEK